MIFIISDEYDKSTDVVIEWLHYLGKEYIRVNDNDIIRLTAFELRSSGDFDIKLHITSSQNIISIVDLSEISSVWYRRGFLNINLYDLSYLESGQKSLMDHLVKERNQIRDFIQLFFENFPKRIGDFKSNSINKLYLLYDASCLDIRIPNTLITSKLDRLEDFENSNGEIITKAIGQHCSFMINNEYAFVLMTSQFKISEEKRSKSFVPSKFQGKLDKAFEIRSFYLNGKFYSMAIFSQNNSKTEVDFRNYDKENPNRMIPCKIPDELENKLGQLAIKNGLNGCSFDIIYTKDNNYVFLEVNPVGQFDWVAYNCNYQIEKDIAEFL